MTRVELASVLQRAGIAASDLRLGYLIGSAELEGLICSGARRNPLFQHTIVINGQIAGTWKRVLKNDADVQR